MADIKFKGDPIHTIGNLPVIGSNAPSFKLTQSDLTDKSLADFFGKQIILNIFPSIDTDVCAMSVRNFNEMASSREDTTVLCISADLPFAASRFCGAGGLDKVITLSDFRHKEFGEIYGVQIIDGPLAGLLSRAVVIIDQQGKIVYTEQVPEIGQEPDYKAALAHL